MKFHHNWLPLEKSIFPTPGNNPSQALKTISLLDFTRPQRHSFHYCTVFFFLRMEASLRVASFAHCGKARAITTHESQQTKHSEALACEHDSTAWYST